MSLFKAFGFEIVELTVEDSNAIFDVLQHVLVNRKKQKSLVDRDIRILNGKIAFVFKEFYKNRGYKAIGLKKDNKLVAVALCNNADNVPWIGHLNIRYEYRGTKAAVVLIHYLLNILYREQPVFVSSISNAGFEKHTISLLPHINRLTFKPELAIRLKRIIESEN